MEFELIFTFEKEGIPDGVINFEDLHRLSSALQDSFCRMIQHDLGYPVRTKILKISKDLGTIGLKGITSGSATLCAIPTSTFDNGPDATFFAAKNVIRAVNHFLSCGQWPNYLPPFVRNKLGGALSSLFKKETKLTLEINGQDNEHCEIDSRVRKSLQVKERFNSDPIEIIGKIVKLDAEKHYCQVRAASRLIKVETKERYWQFFDKNRWKRVYIKGVPCDQKLSIIQDISEVRFPNTSEEDGIYTLKEKSDAEATQAYQTILNKSEKFRKFNNFGWDSYNAQPIDEQVIDFSLDFMRAICQVILSYKKEPPIPFFVPTLTGGVQMEWEVEDKSLEIEIHAKDKFSYFYKDKDVEQEGNCNRWKAINLILNLVGGRS